MHSNTIDEILSQATDTPYISEDLIAFLEDLIPEPHIQPTDTMEHIQYRAGQRDVVNTIKDLYKLRDTGSKRETFNFIEQ
jgi:hypothetical protein